MAAERPLVFAAASLKPALDEILAGPAATDLGPVRVSYAASSQLARQIEHGAPVDLFISADQDWMDHLQERGLIRSDSRRDLVGNALVLIAPLGSGPDITLAPDVDLPAALGGDGRLAMAETNSVPAGRYGRAALEWLGVWDRVRGRVVAADNVRAALNFVVRGEAPLGIVYRSDAVSEPAVRVVDTFPAESHADIIYPAAVPAGAPRPEAGRAVLALLRGDEARVVFERHGFTSVTEIRSP